MPPLAYMAAVVLVLSSALTQVAALRPVPESVTPVTGYRTRITGTPGTKSWRKYLLAPNGTTISWWHNVPLAAGGGYYYYYIEIPKLTRPKYEVTTDMEARNPMFQDIWPQNNTLRLYPQQVRGIRNAWNYGAFPQTWEDPKYKDSGVGPYGGDNDPTDVIDISSRTLPQGVYKGKILGAYALIDDGELDWKVLTVSAGDPLAAKLNDIADVKRVVPDVLRNIKTWYTYYKAPQINKYGYGGQPVNKAKAISVVEKTNAYWKALETGARKNTEDKVLARK